MLLTAYTSGVAAEQDAVPSQTSCRACVVAAAAPNDCYESVSAGTRRLFLHTLYLKVVLVPKLVMEEIAAYAQAAVCYSPRVLVGSLPAPSCYLASALLVVNGKQWKSAS